LKVGHRLSSWIFCAVIIAALPLVGPVKVAAASPAPAAPASVSTHVKPFLSATPQARATLRSHILTRAKSRPLTRHAMGRVTTTSGGGASATTRSTPPPVSTQTDQVAAFNGASQSSDTTQHGSDQELAPPDTDIAAGPSDIVETVNSTIDVFSRTGAPLGSNDLNTFLSVFGGYYSSDPRVIFDAGSQRWWLTITEVPLSFACPGIAAPVLIAVSASSNPLPFTSWIVYELPFVTTGTLLGDQPGLGISTNTVAVSFNDYDCNGNPIGSDIDLLQKTDLEHNSGAHANVPFRNGPFSAQPAQSFGSTTTQYVVANDSDCAPSCVAPFPAVEVDAFTGTPEAGNVNVAQSFDTMTPTAVESTAPFGLPPAQQSGTTTTINTDDDRFLNAVWENGVIWTAGGTDCTPPGDAPRSCLDYVGVTASSSGVVNPTITQINNVGEAGKYLFYPAVSVDAAGDMFTVFDESSMTTFPTILSSTIPFGGSALSAFQVVHPSTTFYDPPSGACQIIDTTNACRWGDYSGAAQDPSNPKDVWVVSEAEDGASSPECSPANLCWGSDVASLTLAPPVITSLYTASGQVAGGATVTAFGTDFGIDTLVTFNTASIAITGLTATSFTFVTPPSATPAGGTVQVQATDAINASVETPASAYTYIGLANYAPVTPFRILDTRKTGGPIGQGLVRALQVTGVGTVPVPASATAAVLNVTEVSGSASSLLTVYPFNAPRPTASNLNFGASTVIANLVTVTLGANAGQGWINIYNSIGRVGVVVDVEGYFTPQPAGVFPGLFHPIQPVRVCDTRTRTLCEGNTAVGSGQAIVVTVATAGGVPGDGTAGAAVVNLTGVAGNASTFLSLFPTDVNGHCNFPGTSTMNLLPGVVRANRAMVELGPTSTGGLDDALCVYNAAGAINVIVDVNGWFGSQTAGASPVGYQYQALGPTRICDTRIASTSCATGAISAGTTLQRLVTVAGHAGVPLFATLPVVAIVANLTAVTPTAATYLTLYPASQSSPPLVSDLNIGAGAVLPNLAVVEVDTMNGVGQDGDVYLYNGDGSVNAIIDLEGWFQ
jgi:hypothetical protein